MEIKYYFKKYLTIYKALNKICIGFVGNDKSYLEIENNVENYNLLERMLKNGIYESDLKRFPFYDLNKKGFLETAEFISNSRSNLYLNYLSGDDTSEKAKEKKLLIFGAGGGGSTLIYLLAQFGFKNIHIVDFDNVESTDLLKVITFDKLDINQKKTESLKKKIKENFLIDIQTHDANLFDKEELSTFIKDIKPDFIVKACDPKGMFVKNLNEICFSEKIPYIMMAYSYEFIKIGPIYVPDITSCNEYLSNYASKTYGEHYKTEYFERMFGEYLFHPSISFNINILSSLIFKEILFFLLEQYQHCQTIGRLIALNPLTLKTQSVLINCNEDCKICKV
ncbi:ThiF family adenylyltransferase [Flavobacterium soyae]|uniref:ThiF family adenylyltransferase n=1 Tax=Flavobacterium soyae TaxID=2903098 RepID=UPI001E3C93C6|nr:ThiF family adenylyltransferase [Flavobacterium soyae]MCD9576281.1 ThiF family adenylyltransferase [Flavobacterium soyae]